MSSWRNGRLSLTYPILRSRRAQLLEVNRVRARNNLVALRSVIPQLYGDIGIWLVFQCLHGPFCRSWVYYSIYLLVLGCAFGYTRLLEWLAAEEPAKTYDLKYRRVILTPETGPEDLCNAHIFVYTTSCQHLCFAAAL